MNRGTAPVLPLSLLVIGSVFAFSAAFAVAGDEERGTDLISVFPTNDLGMHCMDLEFSVYSILPPFNVLNAQVVYRNPNGYPFMLDDTHIGLRYRSVLDLNGSRNSTSIGKTHFWTYAQQLYGVTLQPGEGLLGFYMPADAPSPGPQEIPWNAAHEWFSAEGIPITPWDDAGKINTYPLMRVSAFRRGTAKLLSSTDVPS